jgi:hypothetical protein
LQGLSGTSGRILDEQSVLDSLKSTTSAPSELDSARLAFALEQLADANRLNALYRAQAPVFSGFFGNGGSIPAGAFGIAGERGPEIVTGPATVTPTSGPINVQVFVGDREITDIVDVRVQQNNAAIAKKAARRTATVI